MGSPHAVGIVGLGVISSQYLDLFAQSSSIRVAAVADLRPDRTAEVAAGIPGARLHMVEGAGHLPPLEQPEAVTALLLDWLRRETMPFSERPVPA